MAETGVRAQDSDDEEYRVAVRIRMKKMGRLHRPFYRICAVDGRRPRDGRIIEELGTYDPLVPDTDARAVLNGERINYWLSVGAQPSEKVKVLIRKYGASGTRREQQKAALEQLAQRRRRAPPPVRVAPVEAAVAEETAPAESEQPSAE